MTLAPELAEDEIGAAVSSVLCDPRAGGAEIMLFAHVDRVMPGTLTTGAVDCVIDRGDEDVALWWVLDSWRRTGNPLSPTMQALAQNATDARTKRRFMTLAEETELRAQVAAEPENSDHRRQPGPGPTRPPREPMKAEEPTP